MRAYIDSDILIWRLRGEERATTLLRRPGLTKSLIEGLRCDGSTNPGERVSRDATGRGSIHALQSFHRLSAAQSGALEGKAIGDERAAIPAIEQDGRRPADGIDHRAIG